MRLLLGNFKGPKGEQGPEGKKGNTGSTGQRGSRCTSGTSVTGTSTTGTIFASTGITDSLLHDYYINTSTGNLYECTVPGPADVAEWTYICNIKGPTGATGPAGSISDINNQKPTYTEATTLANISSGETVKIAFGKLKKALSVLMTHYTQQATAAVLGHVKLSNSAAVTQTGQMALDAVEKNASVAGTLAYQIAQQNSNLTNAMDTIDNLLNYMDKTSIWIGVDILKNINNYKFIFLASYTGTVMVNSVMIPKTIFKWFTSGTNFIQVGNSNVYFISDTRVNILSTSDAFRIYGIK